MENLIIDSVNIQVAAIVVKWESPLDFKRLTDIPFLNGTYFCDFRIFNWSRDKIV